MQNTLVYFKIITFLLASTLARGMSWVFLALRHENLGVFLVVSNPQKCGNPSKTAAPLVSCSQPPGIHQWLCNCLCQFIDSSVSAPAKLISGSFLHVHLSLQIQSTTILRRVQEKSLLFNLFSLFFFFFFVQIAMTVPKVFSCWSWNQKFWSFFTCTDS